MQIHSDPASTLILAVLDDTDGLAWQREYPELADAVRVVYARRTLRREDILVTGIYLTAAVERRKSERAVAATIRALHGIAPVDPAEAGRFVRHDGAVI